MSESYARARLRAELVRVRDLAGLSGRKLGDRATGMSRELVRRFEAGETLLSVPRVREWLDLCTVTGSERDRLLELAERANGETRPWAELLQADGHAQQTAHDLERSATLVQSWQPLIVPGLLQTSEYARATLELGETTDVDAAVSGRAARQRQLYDGPARFEFLLSERVLDGGHVLDEVWQVQRDHLESVAKLDRVTVGVIPARARVLPGHPFTLYTGEQDSVSLELIDGAMDRVDPAVVEPYRRKWDELRAACCPLSAP